MYGDPRRRLPGRDVNYVKGRGNKLRSALDGPAGDTRLTYNPDPKAIQKLLKRHNGRILVVAVVVELEHGQKGLS